MTKRIVIPAQAGIQGFQGCAVHGGSRERARWIPAFSGMTEGTA